MKRKQTIYILSSFIALIITALIILYSKNYLFKSTRNQTLSNSSDHESPKSVSAFTNEIKDHKAITPDEMLDKHNRGASALDAQVRFWGKVVDQDDKPVESASIKAIVPTLRMIKVEGGYREYDILEAKSAADGSFMLDGADGFSLTIRELFKEGYVLPSAYQAGTRWEGARYRYRYASIGNHLPIFKPKASDPVVFYLWKLKKPEPVAIKDIKYTGIQLKVGTVPTLLYTLHFMVTDVGTADAPQWELTISSQEEGGGLVKANPSDLFMFEAPESGYTPSISFRYGKKGTNDMLDEPGCPVRFYEKCNKGRWYTAYDAVFYAPNEYGEVRNKMRLWTNPNSSRNLEHDAAHPLPEPSL